MTPITVERGVDDLVWIACHDQGTTYENPESCPQCSDARLPVGCVFELKDRGLELLLRDPVKVRLGEYFQVETRDASME
jgi:hypothetical protein